MRFAKYLVFLSLISGQLARTNPQRVLKAHTHVRAHGRPDTGQRDLPFARPQNGPLVVVTKQTVGGSTLWKNIRDSSGQSLMLPVPFKDGKPITTSGVAIAENQLQMFLYRPNGKRVNYAAIPWE